MKRMSQVDLIFVVGYTVCAFVLLLMTFGRPSKNIEVTQAESSMHAPSVDDAEDLHPGELNDVPVVVTPDEGWSADHRQLIICYHWRPDKPMLCLMPGQSVGYMVKQIAPKKSAEEQESLAWAIANGAGPDYQWAEGAYLSIPQELIQGLELPCGLEAIGVLPEGACPEDIRQMVESFRIADKLDVNRFRWLYPDLAANLQPGQTYARTMQPGQIICLPGVAVE